MLWILHNFGGRPDSKKKLVLGWTGLTFHQWNSCSKNNILLEGLNVSVPFWFEGSIQHIFHYLQVIDVYSISFLYVIFFLDSSFLLIVQWHMVYLPIIKVYIFNNANTAEGNKGIDIYDYMIFLGKIGYTSRSISIYLSIYLSIYRSIYICLYIYLSIYLSSQIFVECSNKNDIK